MIITPFLEINEKIVQISILVVGSLQLYHFLGKFIVFHMHISLYGANLHTCWNKPGTDLRLEKWEKQIFCINFTQKKIQYLLYGDRNPTISCRIFSSSIETHHIWKKLNLWHKVWKNTICFKYHKNGFFSFFR